jgi:hypothetical protein
MGSNARSQTVRIVEPVRGTISEKDRILVVVRGAVGAMVSLRVNGEVQQSGEIRPDGVWDFINVAAISGPNTLVVQQADRQGHVSSDSTAIHVIGPPAQINLTLEPEQLPAESISTGHIEAEVMDAWGVHASEDRFLTFTLDRGRFTSGDLNPEQKGVQVRISEGRAIATIVSDKSVGVGVLTARCDQAIAKRKVRYTTLQKPLTLIGLWTGQWARHTVRGVPAGLDPDACFDPGYYSHRRAALFAKGTLFERCILTTSYDSDRRAEDQVFRMLTPDKIYPIYGDASSLFYEAPSSTRLFAKLERDQSYLLYGDYNTNLVATRGADFLPPAGELMAYNRTFTGVKAEIVSDWGRVTGFGARTDRKIVVDEIAGMGISGYYFLSARPIVDRSEKVVLQTRDRYHPEVVLREERKYRYCDYEINYQQGSLLFKAPVPSRDFEDNPVLIVVSYEAVGGADKAYVGGVRGLVRPIERLTLGGLAVEEERPLENYRLLGVDGRLRIARQVTATGEGVRSSDAGGTGYAWKGELKGDLGRTVSFGGYYRYIERGFRNESSVTGRPGTEKYRGNLVWRFVTGTKTEIEHYKMTDRVNDRKETSTSIKAQGKWKRIDATIGIEQFVKTDRIETRSLIAHAGVKARVTKRLALSLARQQNAEGRNLEYKPSSTTLGTDYDVTQNVSFVVRHEMFKQSFTDSSLTTVGLESRIGDAFTAYSNYHIAGGINGRSNQASIGLRNRLKPHRTVTLNVSHERTKTAEGNAFDFSSYTLGLEFLPTSAWKSAFRYEHRRSRDTRRHIATMGVDGQLMQGLSFILKDTYHADNTRTSGFWKDNLENKARLGLAYRPFRHDLLQVLGKVEHVYERREVADPSTVSHMLLGSIEGIFQPHRRWEVFGRYAVKRLQDRSLGLSVRTWTDLWMARLIYDVTRLIDVGAEYRILSQHEACDARYGWAAEVGFNAVKDLRASVGYNFEGYQDEDLADGDYWARGPYFKLQVKFTERTFSDAARGFGGMWCRQ